MKLETLEQQLEAVKENGWVIGFIKDPLLEVQLEAVKRNTWVIRDIQNPSLEVQLEAVKQDGHTIICIQNPSVEVQLEAVKQNGYVIKHIENPSLEVQLEAVKQNGKVIELIDRPDSKYFDIIKMPNVFRTIYVFKEPDKEPLFSIGSQNNITKEQFIDRIYNTNGGLEKNPHKQEYLDILDRY